MKPQRILGGHALYFLITIPNEVSATWSAVCRWARQIQVDATVVTTVALTFTLTHCAR